MTINNTMLRDLKAERNAGDDCCLPWLSVCVWLAVAASALGAAFFAGASWKAADIRREDDAFNRFLLESVKRAELAAATLPNGELLKR